MFTSVLKNKIDFNEYCNYLIFKNFKNKKDEFCRDFIKKTKLNNKILKLKTSIIILSIIKNIVLFIQMMKSDIVL